MAAAVGSPRATVARRRAGRAGCALNDVQVRDTLYALASAKQPARQSVVGAAGAPCTPWRVEALVLLAFSAYVAATGRWRVSLEAALRCVRTIGWRHAGHSIAVRPTARTDRELAITGYRIAKRLGCGSAAAGVRPARGVAVSDLLDLDRVPISNAADVLVARDQDVTPRTVSTITRALGTTPASLSR